MVTMVTMGGDLQPGSLADRLLTGLGQPQINPKAQKEKEKVYCSAEKGNFEQVGCWPVAAKRVGLLKSPQKKVKTERKSVSSAHKLDALGKVKEHAPRFEHVYTRTLVTYARTIFKPRCCLNFQSMRTQAESTYIAHNMFGQMKMEIPWYINLISR